jgi:hypothetical protein
VAQCDYVSRFDGFQRERFRGAPTAAPRRRWYTPVLKLRTIQFGVFGLLLAGLLVYSQTWAFHWDEGFHLLAARFISRGRRPYLDFLFAQTPLNAYWNALWFRFFHPSWRLPHVLAACETWLAVVLLARYQWQRFPVAGFRRAAAFIAAALFGLLALTVNFGAIAQAYAFCLLSVVAAFLVTIAASERRGWWLPALAGALAGAAPAASLLTAAVVPVLLLWLWLYDEQGRRWTKAFAFLAGASVPALSILWPLVQGSRQVWFDLVQYHALYRRVEWSGATAHDVEVLSSWLQDTQQFLLIVFAVAGWLAVRKGEWAAPLRRPFRLATWLVVGVSLPNLFAHPTFAQYFVFIVPFLAILACAGIYALLLRLNAAQRGEQLAFVLACFMLLALGRNIFESRENMTWRQLKAVADKVNQVAPAGAPILTEEPLYFLTGRQVPYGLEFQFAQKLDLGPERNRLFRIVPRAELERQIKAGHFVAAALCEDDDQIDKISQLGVFKQRFDKGDCTVFWQPVAKSQIQYPPPGSMTAITIEMLAHNEPIGR